MPAFWLSVTAVTMPISRGPTNEVTEILPDAVFRRELNQKRSRGCLQRAADGPDQTSKQEISALGGSREQGAARLRRRDRDK
jgi:hypothetical protein